MTNKPFKVFDPLKLIVYLILMILISVITIYLDYKYVKTNSFKFSGDYNSTILTLWQIQATMVALIIAILSIIISNLELTFYGMSIKEILAIVNIKKYFLSFWEVIVFAILINAVSFIGIIFNSLTCVAIIGLIELSLIIYIFIESLYVILNPNRYEERIKNHIKEILSDVLKYPHTYELKDYYSSADMPVIPDTETPNSIKYKREQLYCYISAMESEITLKIRKLDNLNMDKCYMFFLTIYYDARGKSDTALKEYINTVLIKWLGESIRTNRTDNIDFIFGNCIHSTMTATLQTKAVSILMQAYYTGELNANIFSKIKTHTDNSIRQNGISDYKTVILSLARYFIIEADVDNFSWIVRCIINTDIYSNNKDKSDIVAIMSSYLYYIVFKEDLFVIEKGRDHINRIKSLIDSEIINTKSIYTFKDIIKSRSLILEGMSFALQSFGGSISKWEYIPLGQAKTLHYFNDILEFFAFYLVKYFKDDYSDGNIFESLGINEQKKIMRHMDSEGKILAKYSEQYKIFSKWIGNDDTSEINDFNEKLYNRLKLILIYKLQEQALRDREDEKTRNKKLMIQIDKIKEECQKSDLYKESIMDCKEIQIVNITYIEDIELFSSRVAYFDFEKQVKMDIEHKCFEINENQFALVEFKLYEKKSVSNYKAIIAAIEKCNKEGIVISGYYNDDVTKNEYMKYNEKNNSDIQDLYIQHTSMKYMGKWDCGTINPIYLDTTRFIPAFIISKEFDEIINEISDAEVEEKMKEYFKESKYVYTFDNDFELIFEYAEFKKFIKTKFFKLTFKFSVQKAEMKCGFYTYYGLNKQEDTEND